MENLIVSFEEHQLLYKYKSHLECLYNVKLNLPEIKKDSYIPQDVIFISIIGCEENISEVKSQLKKRMKREALRKHEEKSDVSVILLSSDSDEEQTSDFRNHTRPKEKQQRIDVSTVDLSGSPNNVNNLNICEKKFLRRKKEASRTYEQEDDDCVIFLGNYPVENQASQNKRRKRILKTDISETDLSGFPVHINNHNNVYVKSNTTIELHDSIDKEETSVSSGGWLPDFIPLNANKQNSPENFIPFTSNENMLNHTSNVTPSENENEDDVIVLSSDDEEEIPRPIAPVRLRPIVIDGSNVARAHGKKSNTYSCKGIKISVEYFLERGHTEVTAFVPLFRRHCRRGPILTTDQEILDELEKSQHVVFTPSRRVEGTQYACYDDRFIVELASTNGGVILSNDNYRDLVDESPEFKETINKRLLMFCFVGDKIMVPNDPLGPKGPKLSEFLAFPST